MNDEETICNLFEQLLEKMEHQSASAEHQSFGSLDYHLEQVKCALNEKKYLDPLYIVELPRWLGEYGNTPLEEEIYNVYLSINEDAIRLCGGQEVVNAARLAHSSRLQQDR